MKNIIVYTHMKNPNFNDGGTTVQYLLAKLLEEYGQNVRIYPHSGIKRQNEIFSKFYENNFPIDDNCVVIYCEGTVGNPLNAPNVVRWMLSKLGQNVPEEWVNTWGKNELIYYFNSEHKFTQNPEYVGNIYKLLNIFYIAPCVCDYNLPSRDGTCFTTRKSISTHGKKISFIHPNNSTEITRNHSQEDCVKIFNDRAIFVSYDSITFLSIISVLCGCVSIVVKIDGLTKDDWLNTTPFSRYIIESGDSALYGIAYGYEEIEFAKNTLHLAKQQWQNFYKLAIKKSVPNFIEDVNNWDANINTLANNF